MKHYLTLTFILFTNFVLAGNQHPLPVTAIIPAYDTSISLNELNFGTEVLIGYDGARYPCLEAFPNFEGLTHYTEIDENNNIDITVSGVAFTPCLDLSSTYSQFEKYSLGKLPVGIYNIQMYWADNSTPLPVPPNMNRFPLGENIQFEILAIPTIPILNNIVTIMLFLTIVYITYTQKRFFEI